MKNYLFIFILFTLSNCGRNEIPKNFVEISIPKKESKQKKDLNYSKKEFSVENFQSNLKIDSVGQIIYKELKIPIGTIKTIDNGEWGGEIKFISNNNKSIRIKSGNVKFVFQLDNKIYFIEGLAHLSLNEGELFELQYSKNKFVYKALIKFEDSPEAMCVFKNKIYIAGYKNFYVINNLKKEIIFQDTFWNDLYPNSIAVIDDTKVYIGMRGCIAKINLLEKKIQLYKGI